MSIEEDEYWWSSNDSDYSWKVRARKKFAPPGVHVPNKNEAHLLRKLMSQTGMNETELRAHKKYRKMLSEAQKKVGTKSRIDRELLLLLKEATRTSKLPLEHPKTKEAFVKIVEEKKKKFWYTGSAIVRMTPINELFNIAKAKRAK